MRRRSGVAAEAKSDFVAVTGSAPTAYALHPAVEEQERAEVETEVTGPAAPAA
jgi:hypothetical protein